VYAPLADALRAHAHRLEAAPLVNHLPAASPQAHHRQEACPPVHRLPADAMARVLPLADALADPRDVAALPQDAAHHAHPIQRASRA